MRRWFVLKGLLLTGSALAVGSASGGTALACNPSVIVSGPGSSGGISNNGDIDCVVVKDHAVVNGDVTNEPGGTIGATGSPQQTGIAVHDATINGAIVNRGVISTTGPAISVTGKSAVTGGIQNDGDATVNGGSAAGNARGISVTGASMTGGITNTGTIIVTSGKGRAVGIGVGGSSPSATPPQEPQQ
ncbi:MAG TPA: hypothetical protein VN823_03740 [Stellaceae bacterium]|nr:hypothetical protein [Stellaceae bacterium]